MIKNTYGVLNERLKRKGSPTATFLPEAPLRGKKLEEGGKETFVHSTALCNS